MQRGWDWANRALVSGVDCGSPAQQICAKEENMARTTQTSQVTAHKVGIKVPDTPLERVLVILSRYREASIAVVAIVLVVYFQLASNGALLAPQELSVVLRDTGRFGLIAVAEVMLMITGEIDLSVGSTFSLAPYGMVLMSIGWGVPLAVSALGGLLLR